MRHECYFCHIRTIEKLIGKFNPEESQAEDFVFAVHELLAESRDTANPKLARDIHRIAKAQFKNMNLYAEEKKAANTLLLGKYKLWKDIVNQSENPFYTAAKLSVIGNIIDYGAHSVNGNVSGQIESLFQQALKIDQIGKLQNSIPEAKSVLYLGDNCGEIVFDKLFIETMKHPNVTYVVRGEPVINDVTIKDAMQVGMDEVCRVISNGYDAPSTLTQYCSTEFLTAFEQADLIISKGQGNFEGLLKNTRKNIFFLLIAKCDPMATLLGVKKNDMVVTTLETNGHEL